MTVMPLSGYSIVDFGQVWAGPILSAICADMGASVIRIESRVGSDMARLAPASPQRELLNSLFIYRNRDYYINLNLKTPEGIRLAKEIIKLGDVVVENFAPGVMTRFGLSYEEVRKVRPDVVMISISAGGQTGPWSDLMGYGPSINSLAGTDGFIGYAGENQLMCNIPDADQTAANMGAFAVLAALYHRKRTGEGQYLDMAFLETLGGLLSEGFMDYQMTGRLPRPSGDHHPDMAVHGFFPCQGTDRWVSVAVKTEEEWQGLVHALGDPSWATGPQFSDQHSRRSHREEIAARIAEWTRQWTAEEATRSLQEAGVAAAPANTNADLHADPHHRYRRSSIRFESDGVGADEMLYGIPWRLSETPGSIRRPAPPLGADNERFFTQVLGLAPERVRGLIEDKVIH